MNCISCNYNKLSLYFKIDGSPTTVQVIPKKQLNQDKKINIKLLRCEKCTLVQLSSKFYVNTSYYDDYLMSRNCSPYGKKYQKNLASLFVKQFNLAKKSVVDIGCGDGYFAYALKLLGANVIGIEPSVKAANLAIKRGIKIIPHYLNDNLKLDMKFDAFISCQVVEHLSNPVKFLTNVKRILKQGGYGLIEVPSLIKTLSDNRYYDFFPDHVAYYTPTSLSYLLEQNGFDVISTNHTAKDEYLTAFVKYSSLSSPFHNPQTSFAIYMKKFQDFFMKYADKKIALWGAGAKGTALLSFSNLKTTNILFCVDSDVDKHGKYLAGSHIKISSPDLLLHSKVDIVIITAMMYRNEIIHLLKDKYSFTGKKIAVIAPYPQLLHEVV